MIKLVHKLTSRILIPCYAITFLSLLYWLLVGLDKRPSELFILLMMTAILLLSLAVLVMALLLDRFLVKNMEESLENLSDLNQKLRHQRHEYLNEMQVVYGLLELGETEEAFRFLKPIYQDAARTGRSLKTSLPAVNALLRNKMSLAESENIPLYLEVSSNLSDIPVEAWSICKVLGNLIDNAITAVEGTENGEVHVVLSESPKHYEFCVYNNGPVIEENLKDRIFESGFTSKKEEGHGYGLGIVRSIVKEAGGSIEVSSVPGKTAFTVFLPRA